MYRGDILEVGLYYSLILQIVAVYIVKMSLMKKAKGLFAKPTP